MKPTKAPGFIAYATITMWFLLTVLAPLRANAEEPARLISLKASDILPSIEAALTAKGVAPGAEIALADPGAQFLAEAGGEPVFESVSVNAGSGRFLVRVRGAAQAPALAISGQARTPSRVPVLVAALERGAVIRESDIEWIDTLEANAGRYVLDADSLIGMEARRPLAAGAPLRAHDVAAPVLVRRGELVTIIFETEGLRLTHAGVALDNGGKNAMVEVRNARSERVLKAMVAGENLVAAIPARRAQPGSES